MFQASPIDGHLSKVTKPSRHMEEHARELLAKALLHTNTPPVFLESPRFKEFVQFISCGHYRAPSRHQHLRTVKQLASQCQQKIKASLQTAVAFSIEEDSWTGDGRKFSAVTAGAFLFDSDHSAFNIDCQCLKALGKAFPMRTMCCRRPW